MKGEPWPIQESPAEGGFSRLPHTRRDPTGPGSLVRVGEAVFGGPRVILVGGPCAVEGRDGLLATADAVAAAGASLLRGGAYKPRTSPYDFQGLGAAALDLLVEARHRTGLPFVTEVLDPRDVDIVAAKADMLQIGSRSIQNFPLLKEAGRSGRPLVLKRGLMTTLYEFLSAAEYLMDAGARNVVLCERGIRTFEMSTRNTLDLGAVAVLKEQTHLPVIVDPSHAAGVDSYVSSLSRAAVAVGADGLLVEVHAQPELALSDGRQSLTHSAFAELAGSCRAVARAIGRDL